MQLQIDTTTGPVRGVARDGVRVWRALPYAAPPIGARRFAPPQPVEQWTAIRDAAHAGPVAMQGRDAMLGGVGPTTPMSEDCLTVNVVAPADATSCPVVVWIHGGAFIMGSGSTPLYDGTSFARRHGIVVVTLNYRLGLFGLMYLGELGGSVEGNACLLDQLAALRWVQREIAAFGGDPGNVTVMGESAGAVSIAALLGAPAARGLFHRAILQSGASAFELPTRDDAVALAQRVLETLGTDAAGLAEVPAERLLQLQVELVRERGLGAFSPFVDGTTLPRPPIAAIRDGDGMQVPLLLGSNRDEWALFDTFLPDTTAALIATLRRHLGDELDRLRAGYTSWVDLVGDVVFRVPMIRLAEAQPAPVYMYRFDVTSPVFGGKLGAAHALELPFVWNQLHQPISAMLLGSDVARYEPIAQRMHDTWAVFVRGGVPEAGGLPAWPRYDTNRRTMIIDGPERPSHVVEDPGAEQRKLWDLL
jgi:para-nitrobenzyl esterase